MPRIDSGGCWPGCRPPAPGAPRAFLYWENVGSIASAEPALPLAAGVSLLRWRSEASKHPHDQPPQSPMPSPTFADSSRPSLQRGSARSARRDTSQRSTAWLGRGACPAGCRFIARTSIAPSRCAVLELRRQHELALRPPGSRGDRTILLAVDLEGHWRRRETGPDIGLPQLVEHSVVIGCDVKECQENEAANGRECARIGRSAGKAERHLECDPV